MLEPMEIPRIYVSGDEVEPGIYRDLDTGSLIRLYERDELPYNTLVARTPRSFVREDEDSCRYRLGLMLREA